MERDFFCEFPQPFYRTMGAYAHLITLDSVQYCRQNLLKLKTLCLEDGHEI